jgi:SWIM zinc finger
MVVIWSSEQILALAPDAGSVKNGKALATVNKWQNLGSSDGSTNTTGARALWGECQGSGKNPYQAQIDLSEPAFRCSCPSRKFPCKHGLGLFLLYANQAQLFTQDTPPAWVQEWLDKRAQTVEKKEEKQKAPVDLVAQAKRQQKRSDKVAAGIADLDLWLQDLLSRGLADAQSQPYGFWDGMAARLVDAQAAGLARRVRDLTSIANSGEADWAGGLLMALSKIYLIMQGYQRLDSLDPGMAAEVRSQVGWTTSQDELMSLYHQGAATTQRDQWLVMGKSLTEEAMSNLQTQRTWLRGQESGKLALMLNFAPRNQPLDVSWLPGSLVPAELVFFPGSYALRAIAVSREAPQQPQAIDGDELIAVAIDRYKQALIQNPWLERFPLILKEVTPRHDQGLWSLQDSQGDCLVLILPDLKGWQLLALSGGRSITVMGEWDGYVLQPLGVWHDGGFWQANAGEIW